MNENIEKKAIPATFRLSEVDIDKFKKFAAENNLNQQDAFASLINTLELSNAKRNLGGRENSIEQFQNTINKLVGFYINSLQENETAEEAIRDELSKELSTKDNTINTMYEQLQELKIVKSDLEKSVKEKDNSLKESFEAVATLHDANKKLEKDIEDKQKTIDLLNKSNVNQLEQIEKSKDLKSANELLLKQLEELEAKNLSLDNTNKQLNDKITNAEEMIQFHKDNISELKGNIEAYKDDIKDLNIKHDKYIKELEDRNRIQIEELKAEYERILNREKANIEQLREDIKVGNDKHQEQLKEAHIQADNAAKKEIEAIKEQLNNIHSLEIGKKDLEIEKLKNEIKNIESKNTKVTKGSKNNDLLK